MIIAAYSGITEDQYALLSAIAPTVAYSGAPWSTPWQDLTLTVGKILGKEAEAETLVADTTAWVEGQFAAYPALKEVTFASANDYDGSMAVYAPLDARMKFLTDFGMQMNPSVTALAPAGDAFYYPLSYELFDQLEADISSPITRTRPRSTPSSRRRRRSPIPRSRGADLRPSSAPRRSLPSPRPAPCRCAGGFRAISRCSTPPPKP